MVEIRLQLPTLLGDYIESQIAAGRFDSASDYLQTLVAADRHLQQFVANVDHDDQLVADLNAGLASGPGRLWTREVLAEMKQRLSEKLVKDVK